MNNTQVESKFFPEHDPSQKEIWDAYTGYVCSTCRLIWLGDYTLDDLGEDDYDVSAAERSMAGARELHIHDENESGLNTTCLICDIGIITDGYPTLLLADPPTRAAEQARMDAEADETSNESRD